MSDLSDLDLVAQAMAPTNQPQPNTQPKLNGTPQPLPTSQNPLSSNIQPNDSQHTTSTNESESATEDPLAGIDLSTLSPEELELLQPLLNALKISHPNDQAGEEEIADILAQMDVAGKVADGLEDRLDKLIEMLNKEEAEIGEGLEGEKRIASEEKK